MTEKFNYIEHYKKDAEEFDYFEERKGATEDDERRVREYILSKIPTTANLILDVGSGSAWLAKKFDGKDSKVVSLDISKTNVEKARNLFTGKNNYSLVADSFFLPFQSDIFDVLICSEIIEHVVSPEHFVEEMLRVIKPAGKVILTTPYKEKIRYSLCIHCNKKTPLNAHIHSFDEIKLKSLSHASSKWEVFGNKLLIFSRSYVFLKYLPFLLWRLVDKTFNYIFKKPVHIIIEYYK